MPITSFFQEAQSPLVREGTLTPKTHSDFPTEQAQGGRWVTQLTVMAAGPWLRAPSGCELGERAVEGLLPDGRSSSLLPTTLPAHALGAEKSTV